MIHFGCEDEILTIYMDGRIDAENADKIEREIHGIRENQAYGKVILDLEGLDYISSVGLRVILRLKKKEPELVIIQAASDVYEVFDMTGFTEMIPIRKAE